MGPRGFAGRLKGWARCTSGAVAVEYVVIAAAMFSAIIPAFLYVATGLGLGLTGITDFF